MSIEQKDKIDIISLRKTDGKVALSISDHLDWEDKYYHLITLQEITNSYIEFIEGWQYSKSTQTVLVKFWLSKSLVERPL